MWNLINVSFICLSDLIHCYIGWKRPLNIYVLITWIISLLELICIIVIYLPFFYLQVNIASWIVISFIFLVMIVIMGYLDIRCMTLDPTEPLLYGNNDDLQILYEYECEFCNSYVSEKTKHWKVWNKCIKDFDHHWIWLNNCIGYNNYKLFFHTYINVYCL